MTARGDDRIGWGTSFSGTTRSIAIIIAVALHRANIYRASAVMVRGMLLRSNGGSACA